MGRETATTKAMRMTSGSPEKSRDSKLSGEDQAISCG